MLMSILTSVSLLPALSIHILLPRPNHYTISQLNKKLWDCFGNTIADNCINLDAMSVEPLEGFRYGEPATLKPNVPSNMNFIIFGTKVSTLFLVIITLTMVIMRISILTFCNLCFLALSISYNTPPLNHYTISRNKPHQVKRQMTFPICQMTDKEILKFCENAILLPEWSPLTGWYSASFMQLLRTKMMQVLDARVDQIVSIASSLKPRPSSTYLGDADAGVDGYPKYIWEWQESFLQVENETAVSMTEVQQNDSQLLSHLNEKWKVDIYKRAVGRKKKEARIKESMIAKSKAFGMYDPHIFTGHSSDPFLGGLGEAPPGSHLEGPEGAVFVPPRSARKQAGSHSKGGPGSKGGTSKSVAYRRANHQLLPDSMPLEDTTTEKDRGGSGIDGYNNSSSTTRAAEEATQMAIAMSQDPSYLSALGIQTMPGSAQNSYCVEQLQREVNSSQAFTYNDDTSDSEPDSE